VLYTQGDYGKRPLVLVRLAADFFSRWRVESREFARCSPVFLRWRGFTPACWSPRPNAQQGEVYRIIFIHVPAAWMSMFIYVVMAFWSAVGLAMQTGSRRCWLARSRRPAPFSLSSRCGPARSGQADLGTWWVWDARLTRSSSCSSSISVSWHCRRRSTIGARDRAGALLAIVGVVNIPIIYFSVQW